MRGAADPSHFFLSQDFLNLATDTDETSQNEATPPPPLPPGWNPMPPLFDASPSLESDPKGYVRGQLRSLKAFVRKREGVPDQLRGSVWLQNAVRSSEQATLKAGGGGDDVVRIARSIEQHGTNGYFPIIQAAWDAALRQTFPNADDEDDAVAPDMGTLFYGDGDGDERGADDLMTFLSRSHGTDDGNNPISHAGAQSIARLLCVAEHLHAVTHAPLLPDVVAISLSRMGEAHVFAALRSNLRAADRGNDRRYVPLGQVEHHATCKSFVEVLRRVHPKTAHVIESKSPVGLGVPLATKPAETLHPLLGRFLAPVLRREHVLWLMDLYSVDGIKALFRVGVHLLWMCKQDFLDSVERTNDDTLLDGGEDAAARRMWTLVAKRARDPSFQFNALLEKSYGFRGRSFFRRRSYFPKRKHLSERIQANKQWASDHALLRDESQRRVKPIGYLDNLRDEIDDTKIVPVALARPTSVRANLARWLPPTLRNAKLQLIYSTNAMGRALSNLYSHVSKAERTVTLIEVLDTGDVIGMYAAHRWAVAPRPFGSGECFLFRASPAPQCFLWRPGNSCERAVGSGAVSAKLVASASESALLEQFQVARPDFLSMGASQEGGFGMHLNEDLSKGSSSRAAGFDNDPLGGTAGEGFEVGIVEVYQFVSEVDGKAVDGIDEVWNLDGCS